MMRLIQFLDLDGSRKVARVIEHENRLRLVENTRSIYDLAMHAIRTNLSLETVVTQRESRDVTLDYDKIVLGNRLLQPLDHPTDPAHCLVTGTGLDHLGSALARDAMHMTAEKEKTMSDSMKMFKLGVEGGKPRLGEVGSQPEWFYKGDGSSVIPPEHPLNLPSYALDGGEEAEIVGLYVISEAGDPFRVGFALGNEYSDHVMEKQNYLYLAHSKLRDCSIGPEVLVGRLPDSVIGTVRLIRSDETIWSSKFLTGEANMTHSISNIEYHHFKYERFRRPGDVHCHFFGASVLSFSAGVVAQSGDVFEISAPEFGRPLRNPLESRKTNSTKVVIKSL